MPGSRRRPTAAVIAVALSVLASGVSSARAERTAAEARCQRVVGHATDVLGRARARCASRCERTGATCIPPSGAAARCVAGAERVASRHIARACSVDCPECYGGDCTTFAAGAIAVTGSVVDGLAARVLCDDTGSADGLTAAERRCRRAVGNALGNAAVAFGRCVLACEREAPRDDPSTDTSGCTTLDRQPAAAARCAERARNALERTVRRACPDPPECLAADVARLRSDLEAQIVADYDRFILCGSPGPAFLR